MGQISPWEWLLKGFKIDLEVQLKPKTVKDYCDHVSYFARWAQANNKRDACSITKRDIQEFLQFVACNPAIFVTGNRAKRQNDALTEMMRKAEERFNELPGEEAMVKHTYVVAPRIRWQGMLQNPLCSFWGQELSEVWAGTQIGSPAPGRRRWITMPEEIEVRPEAFAILPEYDEAGTLIAFKVQDPEGDVIRHRATLISRIHNEFPAISVGELNDARISYFDYHATIRLRR